MTNRGRGKRSKTSSIAVSQGRLICSGSCPCPSSWTEWLSCAGHLCQDLWTLAQASFSLRAWSPELHSSGGAAVAEFGSHPATIALGHCSFQCQLGHFSRFSSSTRATVFVPEGNGADICTCDDFWFTLMRMRCWDGLWEGDCRLGGVCQHSWQHLSLCLAS